MRGYAFYRLRRYLKNSFYNIDKSAWFLILIAIVFVILFFLSCAFPDEKPRILGSDVDNDNGEIFADSGRDEFVSDEFAVNDEEVSEVEIIEDFGNDEVAGDVGNDEVAEDAGEAEISTDIFEEEIPCIPTSEYEICGNKIDDDCDGETDEDYTGKKCFVGIGECEESGNEICWEDGTTVCDAEPKLPSEEICDGWDNDCDGETDENLIGCCISKTEQDCGLSVGECKFGKKTCLEDGSWSECIGGVLPYGEICDGKDNNCNGKTDETYLNLGNVCEVGKGECKASGKMVCSQDGKLVVCDAMPGNGPSDEICDGKDNDCDGKTDEDWSKLGNICVTGIGKCAIMGKIVCSEDGKDTICFAKNQPQPSEEICDGIDDDCDGCDDFCEFPELYTQCFVGLGECRTEGIIVCDEKFTPTKCSVSAIGNEVPLPKPEICDKKDNDCDGETDNVPLDKLQSDDANCGKCFNSCFGLPNVVNSKCEMGKCVIVGCAAKFYNVDNKVENGCECSVTSGAVEICDGKDNDCDGLTDEMCDNLVLYLPFDGTWNDASKYGNNAVPKNGASFTNDAIMGQAAYFDGADDYAVVADSASMDSIGEEFTWFVAFKPLVLKPQIIFSKMDFRPGLLIYKYACEPNFCLWFMVGDQKIKSLPFSETNKWYRYTLRYKTGKVSIFAEGSLIWEGAGPYPHFVGDKISIGAGTSGDEPINGYIDEFVFYNKAVSDEDISNYYLKLQ